MAKRNRETLASFFKDGKCPSERNFRDLIDSTVNILDDGFSKTGEEGLMLAPKHDSNTLMSFSTKPGATPSWVFSINDDEDLSIKEREKEDEKETQEKKKRAALRLNASQTIITGDVEIRGIRKGTPIDSKLKQPIADGKWHSITEDLYGIYAMEIVATVCGEKGDGEYAVLVAWATLCYGNHGIKSIGSHYGFWRHKIKIRWRKGKDKKCSLQVKTRLKYTSKKQPAIDCHITYWHKHEH